VAKFVLHTRLGTLQTILLGIVGSVLGGRLAARAQREAQANAIALTGALVH
jgi:uncharacterized membrane protein YeaQ/YmgE (transglycosylase-associated protein family)